MKAASESQYPLSPMQLGMLFQSLYAPQSGVDIEQLVMGLPEELNVSSFQQAWQALAKSLRIWHPHDVTSWSAESRPPSGPHAQLTLLT